MNLLAAFSVLWYLSKIPSYQDMSCVCVKAERIQDRPV